MKIKNIVQSFFESEKSAGIILIACTLFSLVLTNSSVGDAYTHFWHYHFTDTVTFEMIINEGFMAIFFLLVGLELKHELHEGELASRQKAMLPLFAALGGMIFPALIFMLLNNGTYSQRGAGIPIATDIVFALGILSLLGNKVSLALKVFLTAFAVIDDLGAIVVIGLFYSSGVVWANLFMALALTLLLFLLNKMKIYNLIPYLIIGMAIWYFMLHSGIHATLAGVMLAFVIPFEKNKTLGNFLDMPVNNFILPLFALANTCVLIDAGAIHALTETNGLGILLGLILGKPLGIVLFSFISVYLGLSALPQGVNWKHIAGVAMLGGIGFTMSIFIAQLAFGQNEIFINNSKLAILIASGISGIFGLAYLKFVAKNQDPV